MESVFSARFCLGFLERGVWIVEKIACRFKFEYSNKIVSCDEKDGIMFGETLTFGSM